MAVCDYKRKVDRGVSPGGTLTELPLQFGKAAEGGGDEVSVLVLDVFQDVFPVQADGFRDKDWAVQVCH